MQLRHSYGYINKVIRSTKSQLLEDMSQKGDMVNNYLIIMKTFIKSNAQLHAIKTAEEYLEDIIDVR